MPLTPAPLVIEKSRFLQRMNAAREIQDPAAREWEMVDTYQMIYSCARGAVNYINDSTDPEILSLLTDTPSKELDNRLANLQLKTKLAAQNANDAFEDMIDERRERYIGDYRPFPDPHFDNLCRKSVEAEREHVRVTKSLRHVINGSHRAHDCTYDETQSVLDNFLAAGDWVNNKEQDVLRRYGPKPLFPGDELPF